MLKVKVASRPPRRLKNVLDKVKIVRMDSLQNQIGCRFRLGSVSVDPGGFLGPEHPIGTSFHSGITGVTESLRICQMRLAPPKFTLGPFLFVNVKIKPNPTY